MEKLPQECRDHFATYLEREDLNNIVLVSRDYPDYFTASNWYHVWLTGLPVEFTTNLKRFLAAKPDEKHSFIRQATVIPQWAANDHKVFRQQKDPVPGFSNPVFNTHSHLIIQAISKMTCLQRLALVLNVLNDEQQGNFCTMLDTTPKWDTLKALTICAPEGIVPTVLNQCNVKVLVEVNLHAWIDTPGYAALVDMYSALGLRHSLKKLGILYDPALSNSPAHMEIFDRMEGVIKAIKDFPHLTSKH